MVKVVKVVMRVMMLVVALASGHYHLDKEDMGDEGGDDGGLIRAQPGSCLEIWLPLP